MNSTQYSNYDLEQQRQQLEALVRPRPSALLRQTLLRLGHACLGWMLPNNSPRIQQRWQNDCTYWTVYDPVTNRTQRFYSENDLRVWLEGRYYE
ncbi:hypothetical protein GFS31_35290 [Leptolyngbya sp. BL0902]|nr:hypothetical protein GFS31_35290 [Leptolyngbya sp. BL0902]